VHALRFAVLADAHIGRSIPLAVAEYRRQAFSAAFSRAIDAIIEASVDYVFFCGDLFERRTLRPHLVQFAHDELYRLARETEARSGKRITIFMIRGNHDGRPQSDALDYIKHPLADYLSIFNEGHLEYGDGQLKVVGLNYYDDVGAAFEALAKPRLADGDGLKVLMLHGFVAGYHEIPPGSGSITIDQIASVNPRFAFAGHYHKRCPPRRLPSGGWLLTPGSPEMYDFAEASEKGLYIIDDAESEPTFRWVPIEPMHVMRQVEVEPPRRQTPEWFRSQILAAVRGFTEELRSIKKKGYLRVVVKGTLSEGFPGDVTLEDVERLRISEPLLLWVDVDTMELELPSMAIRPDREQVNVAEFFSAFGDFAGEIQEMHGRVRDALEEEASVQTGLLTPSQRTPLLEEWLRRLEARRFRREEK
jgi:DNA repair exonuclease SbcCD nuclease subunit